MKIEKVTYQKAFIVGPYLQEKVGFEASIDGDSPEEVLTKLKAMAEDWHKVNNPHLELEATPRHDQRWVEITDLPITPDPEFEELKRRLSHMEYREDAIDLINNNGFRLNVELNKIANSKPSRP